MACIIVAGMHRSNTSLVANWLKECGVNMGDELLTGLTDNANGHFEDMDFLDWHKSVMDDNQIKYYFNNISKIHISKVREREAISILSDKTKKPIWGFKDPRVCLFLDFWYERIQNVKFLFVIRHPERVVNSLIKREKQKKFTRRPIAAKKFIYRLYYWMFLERKRRKQFFLTYCHYNNSILNFLSQKLDRKSYIVTDVDSLITGNDKMIFDTLLDGVQILKYVKFRTLYERSLVNHFDSKVSKITSESSEAITVYNKLINVAKID